jgi:hypothetical protein
VGQGYQREREREGRTPSGKSPGGLWAGSVAGPKGSPWPFPFFILLLFPFSDFYFFDKFCKKAPNQFKPIPKFF